MPTGPVAVLVNPTAGRGRHRGLLPAVLQALAASGRAVEVVAADTGTAAPAACRAALDAGAGALVAVGGDGTVHLALQAVAGTPVPFGIVPGGTRHDGLLDIVVGGRFTRAGLVRILPRVRRGTHIGHVLVTAHRARTVTVDAPGITAYADGGRIGPLPLTATCVPGALTLLC